MKTVLEGSGSGYSVRIRLLMFALLSRYSISPASGLSVCMFLADSKQRYWSAEASKQVDWNGGCLHVSHFIAGCGPGESSAIGPSLIVHCWWLACVVPRPRQLALSAPPLPLPLPLPLPYPWCETTRAARGVYSLTSATVSLCTVYLYSTTLNTRCRLPATPLPRTAGWFFFFFSISSSASACWSRAGGPSR